jgi:hypothetical protein
VLLLHEGHLQVELRELRLAVGALVLVAEAARDLEVAVHAADHQQLLQLLGRLRQRVELARVEAAGHQIVARALRRALDHDRRLDLDEAARGEEVADELHDRRAQHQPPLHDRAAQVEVAVGEADRLVHLDVVADREGGRLGAGQDRHLLAVHLDRAGRQVRVDRALGAGAHRAGDFQHVFAAHLGGDGVRAGRRRGVEDDLREAVAVAQIDENQATVIAAARDPAFQGYSPPGIVGAQLAAMGVAAIGPWAARQTARLAHVLPFSPPLDTTHAR